MFKKKPKTIKPKKRNKLAILAVAIISLFVAEHGAVALAIHTGVVQGKVQPPALAFGGFDAVKEQKVAALNASDITPPASTVEDMGRFVPKEKQKVVARTQASVPAEKPEIK